MTSRLECLRSAGGARSTRLLFGSAAVLHVATIRGRPMPLALRLSMVVMSALVLATDARGQVVSTADGAVVEFVGLEQWTPASIQRALGYEAPEQLHYCATELSRLGFADSSVVVRRVAGRKHTIITVVEPQYSSMVSYRSAPLGVRRPPESWNELLRVAERPELFLQGGFVAYMDGKGSAQEAWWQPLAALTSSDDCRVGSDLISHSGDPAVRRAAAMVLSHCARDDAAWTSLADALTDADMFVRATALQTLGGFNRHHRRQVAWATALPSLRRVFLGSGVVALPLLLEMLPKSGLTQAQAHALLNAGAARLTLAYLVASSRAESEVARSFLVLAAGSDLGDSASSWQRWLEGQ